MRRFREARRARAVQEAPFPSELLGRVRFRHSEIPADRLPLVEKALRQWFMVCLYARKDPVAMPSRAVDEAWHEFICHTRAYEQFCGDAFGRYLHHTPESAMSPAGVARNRTDGISRTWWLACRTEGVRYADATRLPLLFAVDELTGITGGNRYILDCGVTDDCTASGTTCVRHSIIPADEGAGVVAGKASCGVTSYSYGDGGGSGGGGGGGGCGGGGG